MLISPSDPTLSAKQQPAQLSYRPFRERLEPPQQPTARRRTSFSPATSSSSRSSYRSDSTPANTSTDASSLRLSSSSASPPPLASAEQRNKLHSSAFLPRTLSSASAPAPTPPAPTPTSNLPARRRALAARRRAEAQAVRSAVQSGQINAHTYDAGWVEGLIRRVGRGWEVEAVVSGYGSRGRKKKEGKKDREVVGEGEGDLKEALLLRRIVKKRMKEQQKGGAH